VLRWRASFFLSRVAYISWRYILVLYISWLYT